MEGQKLHAQSHWKSEILALPSLIRKFPDRKEIWPFEGQKKEMNIVRK